MSGETEKILSVTTEVTVYPSSAKNTFLFCIPESVREALQLPKRKGVRVYVVVRDVFVNLIHQRQVELVSGPEVYKKNFEPQIRSGQLYPGQRIRLEVSVP